MKKAELTSIFLDQSDDLFWVVDTEFQLIEANKAYQSFMKEMTGKVKKLNHSVFVDAFGEKDKKKWKTYYQRAIQGESFKREEHFHNKNTDETEFSQTSFEPLRGEDNQVFAVACLSIDISRIVKQRSEAHQLIDSSLDVFCTINKEGNFVFASAAAQDHWGYSPEELVGRAYLDFLVEEDLPKTQAVSKAIFEGKEVRNFENRYKKKDGSIAHNLWSVRWDEASNLMYGVVRDAREKVEAEKKLKLSEQRFKALVLEGNDLYAIIDKKGVYKYMSPSIAKATGISAEKFIGLNVFDFVHPDDKKQVLANLSKVIDGDRVEMELYRAKNHKNEWRWLETVLTNKLDHPAIDGIIVNAKDVTEEHEEKQRLQLLESVITNTKDAVLITEAETLDEPGPRILYVNEAFTKMTGYTSEEVIGKTPRILQGPESNYKELAKLGKALRKYEPCEITTINYKKNGEPFWINFTVTPVADETAWYTHWIAIERDITESKRQEEKLIKTKELAEENEFKMKEAQKLAHLGSWYYDVIHKKSEWSEETYRIWGLDPNQEKIDLVDHEKLVHPDDWGRFNAVIDNATAKGIPYKMEVRLASADGSHKTVNTIGSPIFDENKKVIAFEGTTQDISDRIAIENELRLAKEKAEKSEYAMSRASYLAKIGFWQYDFVKEELAWGDFIYKLYGLTSKDEILSYEKAQSYYDQQSLEKVTKATTQLLEKGTPYDLELRLVNANQEEFYLRKLVEPVYNNKDEIIAQRGVIQDITESRHLEELNKDVSEMVKIGSWSADLVEQFVFWSEEVHKMHETDSASYVPNLEEGINFYRKDFREMVRKTVENSIATGNPWDFEAVIVTAKKNELWIRSVGHAEFIDGQCVRLYGGFQDINSRKESEHRLQSLADSLPGIIYNYVIYPDGSDSLNYVSGNVKEMWGFTPKEVMENVNLIWDQIRKGGDFKQLERSIKKSIETKSKWVSRVKYVKPDGSLKTHLAYGTPSFLSDGTIAFNSIVLDITDYAKTEELLELTGTLAKIGGWEVDLIKQTVFWSDEVHNIYGTDQSSFVPTVNSAFDFYREDFRDLAMSSYQECIATGNSYSIEAVVVTSTKNEVWVRTTAKAEMIDGVCTRVYGSFQNINKEKVAALELEKSLKALKDYKYSLDQSAIIAFTDSKGVITSVNDNFCKISGYSREEAIGQTHGLINSGYHSKEFFGDLWKTIVSGKVFRSEIKNKAKDGSYYWVDTTIVPFQDDQQKPKQYLAIRFNITDRKKAEGDKERFQETLENSLNEIYMFDSKTLKFGYVNKGAMLNLGYTKEELHDLTPIDLKPEYTEESFNHLVSPLLSHKKEKIIFYTKHKRKDGSLYPVEVHLKLVEENDYANFIAIVLDITERKKAEEEDRFKANLLKTIGQAAVATDVNGIVKYWNKAAENIYGWEQEEAIGKEVAMLTPSDVDEKQVADILVKLRRGKIWSGEFELQRKDGSKFPARVSNSPVYDENNEMSGMIGISSDITEEVKNKELLKQYTKELERSNEELEQFAFIASHDLQEPLRMVSSFMNQLERKYGDQLDEKAHQYIDFATDGAKRMKQIIRDLLEYSRSGRQAEKKVEVNLNELVSNFQRLRRRIISEKKATINSTELPKLKTSKAAVTQIFHCIMDNALRYSHEEVPPIIEIRAIDNEKEWEFSVKDNGIGIDPRFHEKIFLIFQRLHNQDERKGTGMGLSVAKRHIDFLGGKIWLQSKEGEGSTFYFTIPKEK